MNERWTRGVGAVRTGWPPSVKLQKVAVLAALCAGCTGAHAQSQAEGAGASGGQASSVVAGERTAQGAGSTSAAAEDGAAAKAEGESPFHFQLNVDYATSYFYHGIIQEDTGLILQPAAKVTANLLARDDLTINAYLATWSSFHGQKTGTDGEGGFKDHWYESDVVGGLAVTRGAWSFSGQYALLGSPSDAYEAVQELDFSVGYDDSGALGAFALHPYASLAIEIGADASDGGDSDGGMYLELGIAPGFTAKALEKYIAISFPVAVGLSIEDYYQNADGEDDTFGFVQVGVKAAVPLLSGKNGVWTLNAGVSGLFLGDHTAEYNGGDHEQVIAVVGLQLDF